jgi:hypothetical protein
MQPASASNGRWRRGQARIVREEPRFGLGGVPSSLTSGSTRGPFGFLRSTRYGSSLRPVGVTGGFAWTQWLTTLTGESPTPSLGSPG